MLMNEPNSEEARFSTTEQSESSTNERNGRAVVEEYTYLLDDVPHLDETPEELHSSVSDLLDLLTNAHAMTIIYQLFCEKRPLRFSELEESTGASPKVLFQRLKELDDADLVSRTSLDKIPPHVEYKPTTKATELDPAFQFLYAWAEHNDLE